MTKSEFIDWKKSNVTQVIFARLKDRVENLKENLIFSAGQNPIQDAAISGSIRAYLDLLNIDFEGEEE